MLRQTWRRAQEHVDRRAGATPTAHAARRVRSCCHLPDCVRSLDYFLFSMEAVNDIPRVVADEPVSPLYEDVFSDGEPPSPVLHKGHLEGGAQVRCE